MKRITALLCALLVAAGLAVAQDQPATVGAVGLMANQVFPSGLPGFSPPIGITSGPFFGMVYLKLEFIPLPGSGITSCTVTVDTNFNSNPVAWTYGGAVSPQTCTSSGSAVVGPISADNVRVDISVQGQGGVRVRLLGALSTFATAGSGTITGVTAGTGLTGGGTSGSVTVAIAAIGSSGTCTNCNLSISATGQVTAYASGSGGGGGANITVNSGGALTSPVNFQNGTNTTASNSSGSNVQFNVASASSSVLGLVQLTGDFGGVATGPEVVNGAHITNASIPNTGLVNSAMTVSGQTCTLGGTCSMPSATSGVLGLVELNTDLGGSATAPTVVNGSHITNNSITNNGLLNDSVSISVSGPITGGGTAVLGGTAVGIGCSTCFLTTGGTLSGELTTVASATGLAGFNLPPGSAPTSPNNGDLWTTSAGLFVQIGGSTIGPLGPGFANVMTTLGDLIIGGASGAPTRLPGASGVNGVPQILVSTPSGGVATAEAWALAGVVPRASPCTSNADTIVATDRENLVTWTDSSACTVTLPQANTTGFTANFAFVGSNTGTGTVTITPTTSTISYTNGSSAVSGASTMPLTTGQSAFIYSNNTNYIGIIMGGSSGSSTITLNNVLTPTGTIATIVDGNFPLAFTSAQTTNSQTAFSFNEATAATGTSDVQFGITTQANSTSTGLALTCGAPSTAFPPACLSLTLGANTGATNVPAFTIAATWNNASIAGPLLNIALTNTSAAATATVFQIQGSTGANVQEFAVYSSGLTRIGGNVEATVSTSNLLLAGGLQTASVNGALGGIILQGSDNSDTTSASAAGLGLLRAGILTAATPNAAALEGLVQMEAGALKGSAVANVGDVLGTTTTAFTLTDCATTGCPVAGIGTSTSNPIGYITNGQALVKLDGALTAIGDYVGMGTTTAGLAHDYGTAGCPNTVTCLGVILADSGSPVTALGSATPAATAMSTTLPLVQLTISPPVTVAESALLGATAAATITEAGASDSVTRAGIATANLTAPWVFQNTNSSNNNTSITMGITAPGTSTGQTVLNVNGAATGGDLADFGTGGTWAAGVLSGQTIVAAIKNSGALVLGGSTASCTVGTGAAICGPEGTTFTPAASVDGIYFDSAVHVPRWNGNNQTQTQQLPQTSVLHSSFTNANTTFTTVSDGTRSWSWPVAASQDYVLDCTLQYEGATATSNSPNFQITGPASPTAVNYTVEGAGNSTTPNFVSANAQAFSSALNPFGTLASDTTIYTAHIYMALANGTTAGTVAVQAKNTTGTDVLTIEAGSGCRFQ